jgi:hypothetical protein
MRRMGLFGAVAGAVACLVASGAAANSSDPVTGTPSCAGHLIAVSNLASGHGPGYFLGRSTRPAMSGYEYEVCTLGELP